MDRRQRKSREAIFAAFTELLAEKKFNHITVADIIQKADVGRATFYAHFETKDFLLKEFCKELFCHIFDTADHTPNGHRHIFECDGSDSVWVHLFDHLQKDDHHILTLLSSQSDSLFWQYFKADLALLVEHQTPLFQDRRPSLLPDSFWKSHLTSTLAETIRWWIENGTRESPETMAEYFLEVV